MTVETTTNKVTANGNDVATSFSFSPMVIFQSSDLVVVHTDADGVETTLTEGVGTANYTVVVTQYPGTGSITYPASGAGKLATGEKLTMKRVLALKQTLDLENQGGYLAENQETAFDKLTMICLQQQEELDRAVKVEISSTTDPASLIAEIIADTAAAAASATAAASSETNAAASETSAAASAAAAAATLAAGMFSAVQDKSADYAVVEGDAGDLLRVDAGSGGVTITLPSIAGLDVPEGFKVAVTKWAGAGNVTIIRSSTDTINGANSYVVSIQYETAVLVADSQTNTWAAIDQSPPLADGSVGTEKLADNAVDNTKMAQLPANTMPGNNTAGTANRVNLTPTQIAAMLNVVGGVMKSKVVNFTYTLSTATGTQAITGVGFKPTAVLLIGAAAAAGSPVNFASIGFCDSGKAGGTLTAGVQAVGAFQLLASSQIVRLYTDTTGSNFADAALSSYDADGFTLAWTKNGSPTGTATIVAICFR